MCKQRDGHAAPGSPGINSCAEALRLRGSGDGAILSSEMSFPPTEATPVALSGPSSAPVSWQPPWPDLAVVGLWGLWPACRHRSAGGRPTLASPSSASSSQHRPQERLREHSEPRLAFSRAAESLGCCSHTRVHPASTTARGRGCIGYGSWGLEIIILSCLTEITSPSCCVTSDQLLTHSGHPISSFGLRCAFPFFVGRAGVGGGHPGDQRREIF